ncbi:hypothetical protein AVEN_263594-1 [Araneus ventricosus]|uniref:Uncharacterized protein n=1 Tax=Araneus ventricosus TaxID=182803 RepID=A0A4Y2HZP4_ARAVE|nr:hypothetical protein AVEN_263594-1 [Araneus ventricosus]
MRKESGGRVAAALSLKLPGGEGHGDLLVGLCLDRAQAESQVSEVHTCIGSTVAENQRACIHIYDCTNPKFPGHALHFISRFRHRALCSDAICIIQDRQFKSK